MSDRKSCQRVFFVAVAVSGLSVLASISAEAGTPAQMKALCRDQAHEDLKVSVADIETKYDGQRADGTHGVSGSALHAGKKTPFKCSLDKSGKEITEFFFDAAIGMEADPNDAPEAEPPSDGGVPPQENEAPDAAPADKSRKQKDDAAITPAKAPVDGPADIPAGHPTRTNFDEPQFNATGELPCARTRSEPLGKCRFGVVRHGNGEGRITIFWPDSGSRVIIFENDTPIRYDESGGSDETPMRTVKPGDLFKVRIGDARFEIPEKVITGGTN